MPTPLNNSVLRAFEILSLIEKSRPEISTATICDQLGLNTATAHRFLLTLEAAGALRSTKRGYFSLGPKVDELGQISEETGAIGLIVKPELERLSDVLDESVMVSKVSKKGPVCVAVANAPRAISVSILVGTVLPFHSSAQGKLWLAEMDLEIRTLYLNNASIAGSRLSADDNNRLLGEIEKVQENSYATNLGDNEPDIAAVSVPVRDKEGKMVLSLSAFGLLRHFTKDHVNQSLHHLNKSAERIANLLN